MTDLMNYKGYYGSVHLDQDELIFYGKLEFIRAVVAYEGNTARQLRAAFEHAVNDYLITCDQNRIEPEKPFKGSLNVRIGKDLHRKIAVAAMQRDLSINSYIKSLLEGGIDLDTLP
jgi:predicted HicB family RNase H-like nuclease